MPITYVIKFEVVPGERARFLTLLAGVLDAMREEAAFHEAVLHQDPDSQYRFMLYETWESHEDVVTAPIASSGTRRCRSC